MENEIVKTFEGLNSKEIVAQAYKLFGNDIVVASSFSIEDQVVTDLAIKAQPKASIITLDTGRVFDEVYQTLEDSVAFWGNTARIWHFTIQDCGWFAIANETLRCNISKDQQFL